MKRIANKLIAVILVLALVSGVAACGRKLSIADSIRKVAKMNEKIHEFDEIGYITKLTELECKDGVLFDTKRIQKIFDYVNPEQIYIKDKGFQFANAFGRMEASGSWLNKDFLTSEGGIIVYNTVFDKTEESEEYFKENMYNVFFETLGIDVEQLSPDNYYFSQKDSVGRTILTVDVKNLVTELAQSSGDSKMSEIAQTMSKLAVGYVLEKENILFFTVYGDKYIEELDQILDLAGIKTTANIADNPEIDRVFKEKLEYAVGSTSEYIGKWELSSITADGQTYGKKEIEKTGLAITLILNSNGSCVLTGGGQSVYQTWSYDKDSNGIVLSEGTAPFKMEDGNLVGGDGGTKLVFKKVSDVSTTDSLSNISFGAPPADGSIRPELKEAMDSYEAFVDEYIVFMKKYMANPTDMTILNQYTEYMNSYTEAMVAFEALGEMDLNEAEAAYFAEVSLRVSKALLDIY